ncbi:unnamed protein product [Adineta steineri]|uniref:G-protein coupled receptors family 1 profile domain-containing protein n=1 Tax=Adineta steineri TaxID=433720 RepID=A0A814FPK1_9BILA|nr:unnamed protein product [Adineta steineri]
MSTLAISSLIFAGKQVTIYGGITVIIAGVLGECLNMIVFLSLRTFRQNSCIFYLTIMSILNIGELLADLLPRIIQTIYNTDGTETSLFYCKFRLYLTQICTLLSLTCFCLATIDQYCATCSRPRLQQLCNIKLARYLIIIFSFIWILHGIPYLIYFQHIILPTTGQITCAMVNTSYIKYRIYVVVLILFGILPIIITVLFGLMAFHNIRQIPHYTIPLVRRELDKQLTVMVLLQNLMSFFTLLPYTVVNIISLNMKNPIDPLVQARIQLSSAVTLLIYYIYYANPFYVYMCASERFRRQLIYVLFKIHLNRWRQRPRIINNQVLPES